MIWLDCIEHELVGHSGKFPPKNQWAINPNLRRCLGGSYTDPHKAFGCLGMILFTCP